MIEEENEDSIDDEVEISEPELEALEKTIEPELKSEDETFEETKELGEFKAESAKEAKKADLSRIQSSLNGNYWRNPKSKDLKTVA